MREKGHNWPNLTRVESIWNTDSMFFLFQCWYDELNLMDDQPVNRPVDRLWETDVVEIFLRPESCDDYFEIEISPLGQWLDAHIRKPRVDVNFNWSSGLDLGVEILKSKKFWTAAAKVPFRPILETCGLRNLPQVGDVWRLNLFRMAGRGPNREFLAWRPTFTRVPDFHVPSAFGNLLFIKD